MPFSTAFFSLAFSINRKCPTGLHVSDWHNPFSFSGTASLAFLFQCYLFSWSYDDLYTWLKFILELRYAQVFLNIFKNHIRFGNPWITCIKPHYSFFKYWIDYWLNFYCHLKTLEFIKHLKKWNNFYIFVINNITYPISWLDI